MKLTPHYCILIALLFALPGCLSQKKIYDQLNTDIKAVKQIAAKPDTVHVDTTFAQDTLCFDVPTQQIPFEIPDTGSYIRTETANIFLLPQLLDDSIPAVSFRIIQRMKPVSIDVPIPAKPKPLPEIAAAETPGIIDIIQAVQSGDATPPPGKKFPSWVLILIAIVTFIKKHWFNNGNATR